MTNINASTIITSAHHNRVNKSQQKISNSYTFSHSNSKHAKIFLSSFYHTFFDWVRKNWIAVSMTIIATIGFSLFAIFQWNLVESFSWDQGIFTQIARKYSEFKIPIVDIKSPGYNLWGDHFHPVLLILGIVYALFPSGISILLVQAMLFGLSTYPLTAVANRRFGTLAGIGFGLAYMLSWGLQNAAQVQFHEICFGVFFLSYGLAAWIEGRIFASTCWICALVFVKEDLGVTVALFGIIILFFYSRATYTTSSTSPAYSFIAKFRFRLKPSIQPATNQCGKKLTEQFSKTPTKTFIEEKTRRYGYFLLIWGVFWLVISVGVILPLFNTAGHYDYTGNLVNSGLLTTLFTNISSKLGVVLALVGVAGVLGCSSPLMLLVIPTLLWRFLGNVPTYWGFTWHYSAVLMPIVIAALLESIAYWHHRQERCIRILIGSCLSISLATSLLVAGQSPFVRIVETPNTIFDSRIRQEWQPVYRAIEQFQATYKREPVVTGNIYSLAYIVPKSKVYFMLHSGEPDMVIFARSSVEDTNRNFEKIGTEWEKMQLTSLLWVAVRPEYAWLFKS